MVLIILVCRDKLKYCDILKKNQDICNVEDPRYLAMCQQTCKSNMCSGKGKDYTFFKGKKGDDEIFIYNWESVDKFFGPL